MEGHICPVDSEKEPSQSIEKLQSPSSGLTEDQLKDIDLLFAEQITRDATLTMKEVRNGMSESCNLVSDIRDSVMVRKVYNHVKYLRRKNFEQGVDNVEDYQKQSTSTWVNTVSSVASGPSKRFCWSKQDGEKILEAFSMFQDCPSKKVIYNRIEEVDELKKIATRNTIPHLYEKVKTIFKQRKKYSTAQM